MPGRWKVVGGVGKGGILVREGVALTSQAVVERLATGAVVDELQRAGERIQYRLVTGAGPREGWVSTAISGKELLAPVEAGDPALRGVWVFGDEGRELRVTATGAGQLRVDMRHPPVLDVFGMLQPEGSWLVAELRPRVGEPIGHFRLRLAEDGGSTILGFLFGEDDWGEEIAGRRAELGRVTREARPWSPELLAARDAAAAAMQAGPGGDGASPWPQLRCRRLLAWSDLHIDMGENMRHLESVAAQEDVALIVPGDVCTNLEKLEAGLRICRERFREVFYVPGNHELWADGARDQGGRRRTSLEKFVEILAICARVGVRTSPAFISEGVAVCPLFSWYKGDFVGKWVPHGGFDNATYWPEVDSVDANNPQLPEIADFFLELNRGRVAAAAELAAGGGLRVLWTCSHFLPRTELLQGDGLLGVMGCAPLDEQVRTAGATGHLFGHSHRGADRVIEGVRYVQQPLGYPTDGHREGMPLPLWTEGVTGAAAATAGILACLPPAAAGLAADRIRGALWGALCADALGMPAQWYYGGMFQIAKDYKGLIKKYVQPVEFLEHSFMIGSATPAIGRVINHGKARYWELADASKSPTRGWHHHFGLKAGENTLEGHMLRLHMRAVAAAGGNAPDPAKLRDEYIRFMTAKGSHNDVWACVYHRVFFARLDEGVPPEDCPEGGEDIETVESASTLIPVILAAARRDPEQAENEIYQTIRVTRQCTRTVASFGRILSGALRRILAGDGLAAVAEAVSAELYPDAGPLAERIEGRKDPMASTFLVESFPSLLHYMIRYQGSVKDLVLANVNVGGENTHRGHILGALAGAAHGLAGIPPEWIEGLLKREEIKAEVEAFVAATC